MHITLVWPANFWWELSCLVYEEFILFLAPYLGVKIFKRVWFNGSFWNTKHINPRSRHDLKGVITNSKKLSTAHRFGLCQEALIMTITGFVDYYADNSCGYVGYSLRLLSASLVVHLYALMVQSYNRILAARALARLPPESDACELSLFMGEKMQIQIISPHSDLHYLVVGTTAVGPYFAELNRVHEFKAFVEKKYKTTQQLYAAVYADQLRADHAIWAQGSAVSNSGS